MNKEEKIIDLIWQYDHLSGRNIKITAEDKDRLTIAFYLKNVNGDWCVAEGTIDKKHIISIREMTSISPFTLPSFKEGE